MYLQEFYQRFEFDEKWVGELGFNPYYLPVESGLEDKILINRKQVINLAANNYLGLAADQRVKTAVIKAVEKYGVSLCGTPIATGYIDLFYQLEKRLSDFLGLESTLILPSCYQANNGLFTAIAQRDDLIIVDRLAHSSLIQGIKAVGCKIRPFLHNNLEHLEGILQHSSNYKQIFVVTESVFSTDGSIAPFQEIVDLCALYNAVPVVDDSHGLGVLGERGRGILEEQGINGYHGIYTASLGKALANAGGIISGSKKIINYLKYYCPHLVYSTALPPSVLAGIEAVLDIIEGDFPLLKNKLDLYRKVIFKSLIDAGFRVDPSRAPINSIKTGSREKTFATAKEFYQKGILVTPFIEPSVQINEGRVRLIAGANLTKETVMKAAAIIREVGAKMKVEGLIK